MSGGKFRNALTARAGLSVSGINHNYDIDATPERFSRGALPILIVSPALTGKPGEFQIATPSGSSALAQYTVTHMLLYAPVGYGKGSRSAYPTLVDLVDNYASAIRANPRLNDTLYLPTLYTVTIAPMVYGTLDYYAARFVHTWTVEI